MAAEGVSFAMAADNGAGVIILLLLVQNLLAHVRLIQVGGVHGADLHGHVLAQLHYLGRVDALYRQVER